VAILATHSTPRDVEGLLVDDPYLDAVVSACHTRVVTLLKCSS
jgi:hypothetical protein